MRIFIQFSPVKKSTPDNILCLSKKISVSCYVFLRQKGKTNFCLHEWYILYTGIYRQAYPWSTVDLPYFFYRCIKFTYSDEN